MAELTEAQKWKIMGHLGRLVIRSVRDGVIKVSVDIAALRAVNPKKREQYAALAV